MMESAGMGLQPKPDQESSATQSPSDMWAVLPEQLRSVTIATEFVSERHRWNTNEEVASLLVAFDKHQEWLQTEVIIRPPSGTLLFYSKQNQRYRKDGYFWKKRRDGKTTREDHMKLKVSGVECIYGCYVHSAILPTFHRRSYWLLQNPDIVLVHYLNLPLSEETPLPPLTIQPHKQQWDEGQLLAQLRPMFARSGRDCTTSVSDETVQSIASTLLENQRRLECLCGNTPVCKCCKNAKSRSSPPQQTLTYLSQKATLKHPLRGGDGRNIQHVERRGGGTTPQSNNVFINKTAAKSVAGGSNGGSQPYNSQAPLILNLSQLHGNNSLIILSSAGGRVNRPMTIISQKPNSAPTRATNHHQQPPETVNRPLGQKSQNAGGNNPPFPMVTNNPRETNSVNPNCLHSNASPVTSFGHTHLTGNAVPVHHLNTDALTRTGMVPPVAMTTNRVNEFSSINPVCSSSFMHPSTDVTPQFCNGNIIPTSVDTHTSLLPSVTQFDSVGQNLYGAQYMNNGMNNGAAVTMNGCYGHQSTTAAISSQHEASSSHLQTHNMVAHSIEDHSSLSGGYHGKSLATVETYVHNNPINPSVLTAQDSVSHVGGIPYSHQTISLNSHAGTLQANGVNGAHMGGHMTPHAMAQLAESDMVVDSLIREMNLQQNSSHGAADGSPYNTAMQISPSHSDLTLDDLDLSFLDSVPSPLSATSTATYTSPAVTMVTTPSPSNDRKDCCKHSVQSPGIVDLCPEWAYKEGGEKVLLIGGWQNDKSSYAVLFDGVAVPAVLLQGGVLRCICPEHKTGSVKVEVACDGHVISNSVMFEYRSRVTMATTTHSETDWFAVKDLQLQTWLLERLQQLEKTIDPDTSACLSAAIITAPRREVTENLELRLIECVQRLSEKSWPAEIVALPAATRGLTLLHLAAALGYASLINCLIGWRRENPTSVLLAEVDAIATDHHQTTPLAWSCALGHQEASSVLYQYNATSLVLPTTHNQTAIDLAKHHGHMTIATKLSALEKVRLKTPSPSNAQSKNCGDVLTGRTGLPCHQAPESETSVGVNSVLPSERDLVTPVFKVPASPLHSTPTKPNRQTMDSLSVHIPNPHGGAGGGDLQHSGGKPSRTDHKLSRRAELLKRLSVEVLPDYPAGKLDAQADSHQVRARSLTLEERRDSPGIQLGNLYWGGSDGMKATAVNDFHQVRAKSLTLEEASIDPQCHTATAGVTVWGSEIRNDPMLSMNSRDLNSPVMFMAMDASQSAAAAGLTLEDLHQHTAMETESSCNTSYSSSPPAGAVADNKEGTADSQEPSGEGNQGNHQMATLANQIIAAMPERIKLSPSRSDEHPPEESASLRRDRSSSYGSFSSCSSSAEPPCAEDSGISTPLEGIAFEDYRYVELATPTSSLSPASSLHSPYMDHFSLDSPPPTAEEFNEYFNAPQTYLEKDFSQLTLSDSEQRNLYAAAKIIQNFYRRYKDRKEQQMLQRQRELEAVVLIQSYYRRYKQYRYYKKMSQAAVLIQSQFRSYFAQKRYRQRREAATLIQNRYRAYKEQKRFRKRKDAAVLIQQRFRNHYQRKYQKNQKSGEADRAGDSSQKALVSKSREATPSSSTRSEKKSASRRTSMSLAADAR